MSVLDTLHTRLFRSLEKRVFLTVFLLELECAHAREN